MPHAAPCAFPGEAVVADADPYLRSGPDRLGDTRLGTADADKQPDDPAVQDLQRWRNAKLVLFDMLNER